jgi:hypothetical protein
VRLATLLTVASAAVLAAPAAHAQSRNPATITGTIRSEGQKVLDEVEITVAGATRSARTSPNGIYTLDSVPSGPHIVQVRRLGYRPLYFAVTLKPGERREVDVELAALPQRLSAVQVKERSGYGVRDANRLRDFEWRRRATATQARFLTRDDLARRYAGAGLLFNAIRTEWPLVGCSTIQGTTPISAVSTYRGGGGRRCRVAVSVDGGLPMDGELAFDYPLNLVEAVEIYRGGIGMPIEFQSGPGRNADVVLVVWTGVDTDP